jgi:hypothetical protein
VTPSIPADSQIDSWIKPADAGILSLNAGSPNPSGPSIYMNPAPAGILSLNAGSLKNGGPSILS